MFNRKIVNGGITKETQIKVESNFQAQATATFNDFAQVYDTLFPRIYSYVSYRVNRREEAEDLVGQIFEKALASFAKFDARKGTVESWLFTIAHNTVVNYYRSHKRHPQAALDENLESDAIDQPGELMLRQEELEQLRRNLAKLNDRERELIALRFGANQSHREIGQVLGMNEGSVTVALSRAISKLRRLFEADENE